MINIDEIEEICDAMIDGGFQYCPPAGCGSAEKVKEIITRLREAEKDAARYRWLTNQSKQWTPGTPGVILVTVNDNYERPSYTTIRDVDSFINEAMQCK